MVQLRTSAKGEFLLVILAVAAVSSVIYGTRPNNPSINVRVINNVQVLDNITIGCFQCVPFAKDKWEATLMLAGVPLNTSYYGTGSSVGVKFSLALASQVPQGSTCTGYALNYSTCLRLISLPFNFSFDIRKTSSGGYLQATVYLKNGESFKFPATSGGLNGFFNFQSG